MWPFGAAVPLLEGAVADAAELRAGGLVAVREVGVGVAEVLRQVELEPLGELDGAADGGAVETGEALLGIGGRQQDGLVVPAPLGLAAVQRGAAADGDERVLEARAGEVVRVRVAGGDGLDAERLGEVAQGGVPAHVAALERPLELDVEALGPEGAGELGCGVRVVHAETVARAAGQADEPLVELGEERRGRARAAASSLPSRVCA